VHVEHDGAAGLAAALRLEPDALLLDLGMPGMDGLQVAARRRATAAGTRMAIVAISGWGQEEDRRRTREAGFDAHLTKPVDPEELGRTLAALCGTPAR
jgi:DNA-binding response OmpR family regulator